MEKNKRKINAINLNGIKIYAVWFRDTTSIRIFAATHTHSWHFHINNNNNNEIKYINENETVYNAQEKISDEVIKVINVEGTCNLIFRAVPKEPENLHGSKEYRFKYNRQKMKWSDNYYQQEVKNQHYSIELQIFTCIPNTWNYILTSTR